MDAKRDWGHAKDYVEMQWLMLQQDNPEDFVIATGQQFTVREFVKRSAEIMEMKLRWEGSGLDEKAYDEKGNIVVQVDPKYFRPAEVETLLGDASKAREKLKWTPKISFDDLVKEMALADLELTRREVKLNGKGLRVL
jgi:GDPmannose 4,6-dehydratase